MTRRRLTPAGVDHGLGVTDEEIAELDALDLKYKLQRAATARPPTDPRFAALRAENIKRTDAAGQHGLRYAPASYSGADTTSRPPPEMNKSLAQRRLLICELTAQHIASGMSPQEAVAAAIAAGDERTSSGVSRGNAGGRR